MANERLRAAILAAGLTVEDVSAQVQVDVKTVERWIANEYRMPHRATRQKVARLLSVDEVHLWLTLADDPHTRPNSQTEVIQIFPTRSAIPHTLWSDLLSNATRNVDILVISGTFLVEQYNLIPTIRAKLTTHFRILVGDEASAAVIRRAKEEGTSGGLEGRAQLMRQYLREVEHLPKVEIRAHGTPLYNSIYRFDDQMFVNGHAYGSLAGQNPVLHLRHLPGGLMWDNYLRSFDRVWSTANPDSNSMGG